MTISQTVIYQYTPEQQVFEESSSESEYDESSSESDESGALLHVPSDKLVRFWAFVFEKAFPFKSILFPLLIVIEFLLLIIIVKVILNPISVYFLLFFPLVMVLICNLALINGCYLIYYKDLYKPNSMVAQKGHSIP